MVLSALLSISCMLLLGFADDVLDLRWRHKGRYTLVLGRVGSDRRPGRMPDREILVDSKIMVVAIVYDHLQYCKWSYTVEYSTNLPS